jgi:dienelactone hydrolase
VEEARGRGAFTSIITYPGAYHDFDRPNFPVRQRKGLAFTANGSGTAHLGTNEAARTDAITRVPQWLSQ